MKEEPKSSLSQPPGDWMTYQERGFRFSDDDLSSVGNFDATLGGPIEISVHISAAAFMSLILVYSYNHFCCALQGLSITRDVRRGTVTLDGFLMSCREVILGSFLECCSGL